MHEISIYKIVVSFQPSRVQTFPNPVGQRKSWDRWSRSVTQSRTQNPQAFWSAGGRQESFWGTGIVLPQDFCVKQCKPFRGKQSKNLKFFELLTRGLWVRDCQ